MRSGENEWLCSREEGRVDRADPSAKGPDRQGVIDCFRGDGLGRITTDVI